MVDQVSIEQAARLAVRAAEVGAMYDALKERLSALMDDARAVNANAVAVAGGEALRRAGLVGPQVDVAIDAAAEFVSRVGALEVERAAHPPIRVVHAGDVPQVAS